MTVEGKRMKASERDAFGKPARTTAETAAVDPRDQR